MPSIKKKISLNNILSFSHYMKIVIDEGIEVDEEGNYLINVGYLRVSTDRQAEEGYGLEIQEENIIHQARLKGLTNLVLFIDDGFTGTDMSRPALRSVTNIIQDFNSGLSNIRMNLLMVYKMDRLGRTLLGILQFMQDYLFSQQESKSLVNKNRFGISFYSVEEPSCSFDRRSPLSTFMIGIFATMAEYDRDTIVRKLKAGKEKRLALGYPMGGGNIPYGYRYDKEKDGVGNYVTVPAEKAKFLEARRLFIEEHLAPAKIKDILGFTSEQQVIAMLKRRTYLNVVGYFDDNHNWIEYPAHFEAFITEEEWQEQMDEFAKRSVIRSSPKYMLSGLLVCGECGAKFRYQKWGKSGECKLVCYSRQKSKPYLVKDANCDNELYWASDVESAVVKQLFAMTYLGNADTVKSDGLDVEETLTASLNRENKLLNAYYTRYDKALVGESDEPIDALEERIQEISKKIKIIKFQIENTEERKRISKKVNKAKGVLRTLKSAWPKMTDEEKQIICRDLIERIVIHKGGVVDVYLRLQNYLVKSKQ